MSHGYGVTPDEIAAVSRAFAGQVPLVAEQARPLRDSPVSGTTTGDVFHAEGEVYATVVARMARSIGDYAAHVESIAGWLAAGAEGYATAESGNAASFRGMDG
ncbi:MAG: hypothetical protein ACRDRZ_18605 [Pseudonocardiaceae bacterium]